MRCACLLLLLSGCGSTNDSNVAATDAGAGGVAGNSGLGQASGAAALAGSGGLGSALGGRGGATAAEPPLKVFTGGRNTCAVLDEGTLKCWGARVNGILGDGRGFDAEAELVQVVPLETLSFDEPVRTVTLGRNHSCALLASGEAQCWGSNELGQLGTGSEDSQSAVPVAVPLPHAARVLEAGGRHTCALLEDGSVYCWGSNRFDALGTGVAERGVRSPRLIASDLDLVHLDVGWRAACATSSGGQLYCWGLEATGVEFDEATGGYSISIRSLERPEPMNQFQNASVASVSVGDFHRCVVTVVGDVKCWGANPAGQTGNGIDLSLCAEEDTGCFVDEPIQVSLPGPAVQVEAGATASCARLRDGSVWCWGQGTYGGLADGAPIHDECIGADKSCNRSTPIPARRLQQEVVGLSLYGFHGCAVKSDGAVLCWGSNWAGQLGTGNLEPSSIPLEPKGL